MLGGRQKGRHTRSEAGRRAGRHAGRRIDVLVCCGYCGSCGWSQCLDSSFGPADPLVGPTSPTGPGHQRGEGRGMAHISRGSVSSLGHRDGSAAGTRGEGRYGQTTVCVYTCDCHFAM